MYQPSPWLELSSSPGPLWTSAGSELHAIFASQRTLKGWEPGAPWKDWICSILECGENQTRLGHPESRADFWALGGYGVSCHFPGVSSSCPTIPTLAGPEASLCSQWVWNGRCRAEHGGLVGHRATSVYDGAVEVLGLPEILTNSLVANV